MRKSGIYQYYVEGEDERSLLNTLKLDLRCIESGKIDKFNVIQSRFTTARPGYGIPGGLLAGKAGY